MTTSAALRDAGIDQMLANAWGGLAKKFAHLIEPVGYRQSLRLSAHARLTRTYKRK